MELTEKNLLDYIRKEYESLTNPVYFQYGYQTRSEAFYRLRALDGIVTKFDLGHESYALDRDIRAAMERLKTWCDEHHSWGF